MLIVWVVLGLLVAMAVLTWWQPLRPGWVVGLAAVAPLLYFAAWPCAVVAGLSGAWSAFVIAVALVLSQLGYALPSMRPWSTVTAPADDWRLTVYVHNVLYRNLDLSAVAAQIALEDPDVIALVEIADGNFDSLVASNVLAAYPFHAERLYQQGSGCGVWSKVPMTDTEFGIEDKHSLFAATLTPDRHPPLTLFLIHTTAPVTSRRSLTWANDLAVIADRVRGCGDPLILTGDFNATLPMRRLRQVLRAGALRDAGTSTGDGWRMTWQPVRKRYVPPVMRIDHLFHSPGLTVTDYRIGSPAGSDHVPLLVTIAAADSGG